jgi:hypothetical protein
MSFWTGFGTGLAKSVDQGLQKAMSKRDDELSRAKTFWQTRQAQKLDQKEAYDARAEKALRRLIRETGSSTLGLAAFNAAGGDADGAEDFLKNVDTTRNKGLTYNIRENLTLPEDYKAGDDIEESAALKSVRMQMKGIDATNVKIDDPLSKFGLGLKGGAAQGVADEVNSLIEPEIVETLNNIPNVTIDRSGFVSAKDRQREIENSIPGLDKQLGINTSKIVDLDKTSPTYEADLEALEDETAKIILAKTMAAKADEAGSATSGTKLTEYLSMSKTIRTDVDDELGYTAGSGGTAPSITSGPQGELSGDAAVAYRNQILAKRNEAFVRNNLVDKNGEPVSADAKAAVMGKGAFRAIANRIKAEALARKDDGEGDGTGTAADATKVEIPFDKQKIAVQANPMGALTKFMKVNGAKATPDAMLNLLRKYEYSDDEAIGLIQEVMKQNQPAPKKPSFADLTNKQTSVAKVDPRPSGSDQASQYAANDWDNQFAATHNPDGTPK